MSLTTGPPSRLMALGLSHSSSGGRSRGKLAIAIFSRTSRQNADHQVPRQWPECLRQAAAEQPACPRPCECRADCSLRFGPATQPAESASWLCEPRRESGRPVVHSATWRPIRAIVGPSRLAIEQASSSHFEPGPRYQPRAEHAAKNLGEPANGIRVTDIGGEFATGRASANR